MKALKDYLGDIMEDMFATPENTLGIGNPMVPDISDKPGELSSNVGSGDVIMDRRNTRRRKRIKAQNS